MLTSQSQASADATTVRGWTQRQIEARLGRGGKARLARRAACHWSAIHKVIRGEIKSRRLEGVIAQALRVPREQIFPVRMEAQPQQGESE